MSIIRATLVASIARLALTVPLVLMVACPIALAADAPFQGRDWTIQRRIEIPGYAFLQTPLLKQDADGSPVLYAYGGNVSGNTTLRIAWRDSSWVTDWELPFTCGLLYPVPTTLSNTHTLIWKAGTESPGHPNACDLIWTDADAHGLINPDTLAFVWPAASEYAAAVTPKRRWAAVSDYTNFRFFDRRENGPVTEWEVPDQADMGIAIGALSDTSALVVWGSLYFGFRWAIANDVWNFGGDVPGAGTLSQRPRLRTKPSGGLWLAWGGDGPLVLRSFLDGEWGPVHEFTSDFGDGQRYYAYSPDLSRDGAEWPTVAWSRILASQFLESICVAIPDESGNYVSHFVPNSEGGELPTVLRDRFGDVWVGWDVWALGTYWSHSYTRAEPRPPTLSRVSSGVRVSWTISEPAPGSHWTVVRENEGQPEEAVGTVVAGSDTLLVWTDPSDHPEGHVGYRIRRESVDRRFEMITPDTQLPAVGKPAFSLRLDSGNPTSGAIVVSLRGAQPGPARVELFDATGRRSANAVMTVASVYAPAAATLTPESELRPGVYFVRAIDAAGKRTAPMKVVLIR